MNNGMGAWDVLDAILKKNNYTIINDYGVLFNRLSPGFMFVDSPWPGYCITDISLVYLCNDASEFFNRLEIENATQLDLVKPEVFLKLFRAGEVIVVCSVDEDQTLEFQMNDGKLMANKEDSKMEHEVTPHLETAGDFIEYTKQYFRLAKCEGCGN